MVKEETFYSKKIGWRRKINIYLPSTYNNIDKFPVIYAFDGANLYDPKNSLSGYSWDVENIIEKHIKEKVTKGYIVVGVYTSKNRLFEYTPVQYKDDVLKYFKVNHKPIGDTTLDFFDEVKEYIDKNYLTNGINHIMGSSCGGIMSLYALMKYPHKYSSAGIFSIASTLLRDDYHKMLENANFNGNKAFVYMGDKESSSLNGDVIKEAFYIYTILSEKGVDTYLQIGKNKKHNELAWQYALDLYIRFIEK